MLLREFSIDNHTLSLTQDGDNYIAMVTNKDGEKIFYHDYKDYEKIKSCFDEIVKAIETDNIGIEKAVGILKQSSI